MRTTVVLAFALTFGTGSVDARAAVSPKKWFRDCSVALEQCEFAPLATHLQQQALPGRGPDKCFRFNNQAFLATLVDAGRANQGLYYCNLQKPASCKPVDSRIIPNIEIQREFFVQGKQRAALISYSNLSAGTWDQGYIVLHLTPSNNPPFSLQELLNVNEDPLVGLCGGADGGSENLQGPKAAERIDGFEVKNAGSRATQLVFRLTRQDCSTREQSQLRKIFEFKNGKFVELPAQ